MFVLITLFWIGLLIFIIVAQSWHVSYYRHLCELRQNSIDFYRIQLSDQQQYVVKEVNDIISGFRQFYGGCESLLIKNKRQDFDLRRMESANNRLVDDLTYIILKNSGLEEQVALLKSENARLKERNEELEYALNLESISMLEKYQEQGKLFTAINDIRRSLSRILNPA